MEVKTISSIEAIAADEWNRIVGENRLICRHEFLLAVERSRLSDFIHAYVLLYEGDQLVGHASLCALSTELDTFATGYLKRCIECIRKVWKGFLVLRSVECGCPIALGSTITLTDSCNQAEAIHLLTVAAEQLAAAHRMKVIMFRDFTEQDRTTQEALKQSGYSSLPNLPSAELSISWDTFDGYLHSLRSSYRNKVKARKKALREAGITIEYVQDFGHLADDLLRLWTNVYDRAKEYRREVLNADFFRNMNALLGSRTGVIAAMHEGRLVGFVLLLFDDRTLVPLYCGLDYSVVNHCPVYINLFYSAIDIAISSSHDSIDFGITTLEPKIEIGAELAPLTMYMKDTRPITGKVTPRLFAQMTPAPPSLKRKVFRDDAG
jgi:predicted N-acyltransferase